MGDSFELEGDAYEIEDLLSEALKINLDDKPIEGSKGEKLPAAK